MVGSCRAVAPLMQLATFTQTLSGMSAEASHHPSPGAASAYARSGPYQRRDLQSPFLFCHVLGPQIISKLIVGGHLNVLDAIQSGQVELDGNIDELVEFLNLFDNISVSVNGIG